MNLTSTTSSRSRVSFSATAHTKRKNINSTVFRAFPGLMLFLLCAFSTQSHAQCGAAVTTNFITVDLDPGSGTATLNDVALAGIINPAAPGCNGVYLFFTSFPSGGDAGTHTYNLDCNDLNSNLVLWVVLESATGTNGVYDALDDSNPIPLLVTVIDNTPPAITCPANIAVGTDAGVCYANQSPAAPVITDNCSNTVTYVLSGATTGSGTGTVPATDYNSGITTVEYTVTEDHGFLSSTQCSFTVTVTDDENPIVICPANKNVGTDATSCFATNVSGIGMTEVTAASNPGEYSDNCDVDYIEYSINGNPFVSGSDAGSDPGGFPKGVNTVSYHVVDASGHGTNCGPFNVTVADDDLPLINCPASVTVSNNPGACIATPVPGISVGPGSLLMLGVGEYADNCGVISIQYKLNGNPFVAGTNAGTNVFPLGATSVTYKVSDLAGNTATCALTVTVKDTEPPVISGCPSNQTVNATTGDCSQLASWIKPTAVDLCSGPANLTVTLSNTNVNVVNTSPTQAQAVFPVGPTTLFYTFSDNASPVNSATCSFVVTVLENQAPTAICKDITVDLDNSGTVSVNATAVNNGSTDNCTTPLSFTLNGAILNSIDFNCSNLGNNIVELWVKDVSNNVSTCAATIRVRDVNGPVVTCPANTTVSTTAGACTAVAAGLTPSATDNCTASGSITYSYATIGASSLSGNGLINGQTLAKGVTIVTYQAKDASNNTSVCTFSVTVNDTQAPQYVSGQANGVPVSASASAGQCSAVVSWTPPTFSDNCGVVNVISTNAPGSTFPVGPTVVVYTASDLSGNTAIVSFTVTVEDNTGPIAQCKNISVNLDNAGSVSVNGSAIDAGSQDDCGISSRKISKDGGLTYFDPITFNCLELGVNSVILQVKDANGNASICNANITVKDVTNPTPVCHNLTVNLSSTNPGAVTVYANDANPAVSVNNGSTDNCTITTYEISNGGGAFASSYTYHCGEVGGHVVTLRVIDQSGNSASCNATVTVQDVNAPVVNCPANVIITTSTGGTGDCNGSYTWNNPTPSDNCNIILFRVTVLGNNSNVTAGASITRNFPTGVNTVTYRANDENGNSGTCSFTVTVNDNEPPSITCAASGSRGYSQDGNAGDCYYQIQGNEFNPGSTGDNCGILSLVNDLNGTSSLDGEYLTNGNYIITWTVTDVHFNTSTCTVSIEIVDDEAPVFNFCPPSITLPAINGNCNNLVNFSRPIWFFNDVTDCDILGVTETVSDAGVQASLNLNYPYDFFSFFDFAQAVFPVGTTKVTYTASDAAGNTSTCFFNVNIIDTQAPSIACPANQTLGTICGNGTVPNYKGLALITDNCTGGYFVTQTPAVGTSLSSLFGSTPSAGQTFNVTLSATNSHPDSLSSSCSFTVTLADQQNPIPNVAGASLASVDTTCGSFILTAPTATDCGITLYGIPNPAGQFIAGTPPRYLYTTGSYNIVWTYIDNQNNTSSQSQLLTITEDSASPVAICKNATLSLASNGKATLDVANVNNGSYDNCTLANLTLSKTNFTCDNLGSNTVTLTATDGKGHTGTCTATVTIQDLIPPTLSSAPADVTIQCGSTIPAAVTLTATDNCTVSSQTFNETSTQTASGCSHFSYLITRVWTAVDQSNNISTKTQFVTVVDNQAPVFSGVSDTITVFTPADDLDCEAPVTINLTSNISDCAGFNNLTISNNALHGNGTTNASGIYNVGTYNITFTAIDPCGNPGTKKIVLRVKDGTAPTAICVNNIAINLNNAGSLTLPNNIMDNGSFDNCPGALQFNLNPKTFNCSQIGQNVPVVLTVTDLAGNSAVCNSTVLIQDNNSPVYTSCPSDVTINCGQSLDPNVNQNLGFPTSTDNCGTPNIAYVDQFQGNPGSYCGSYKRTWTATDAIGNTRKCTQFIDVIDNTLPSLTTAPADLTIECGTPIPAPATLVATDNCDANVEIVFTQDSVNVVCNAYAYKLIRRWTAIDDCGNTRTRAQNIQVRDTQAPTFTGAPAQLTVSTNDGDPNACQAPVNLNLAPFIQDCNAFADLDIHNNSPIGDHKANASGYYAPGNYAITFEASDKCGNVSTHNVNLTVIDNSVPTAICYDNIVVSLGSNGSANIDYTAINDGSYDNCTPNNSLQFSIVPSHFDCTQLGQNTVTMTVVDAQGNLNVCHTQVQVSASNPGLNFTVTASGTDASFYGGTDGKVTASASGGSNNFSYHWNTPNNDATSSVTGLPAGTYVVTATDNVSGCQSTATAIVNEGPQVHFIAGDEFGAFNDIVVVPVSVEHFNQIVSFQFGIHVDNAAVATVLGVNGFNLPGLSAANFSVAGNTVSVSWSSLSAGGVSIPDGQIIFNVRVKLIGNVGQSSPVSIDGTPLALEVVQDHSGTPVVVPAVISDGSVNIILGNEVFVSGNIHRENGDPVGLVQVSMAGTVSNSSTTGADGKYIFTVPVGSNETISPSKDINPTNGVTVTDLAIIQQHILGNILLDSPYKYIAADVNRNGSISTIDIVELRYLILGNAPNFSNNKSWRFVPQSYVFPSPNPLSPAYPETISYSNLLLNQLDSNFIGVKIGDVNNTANVNTFAVNDERNSSRLLTFEVDNPDLVAGQDYRIAFRARDFRNMMGYQMSIAFDPSQVSVLDVIPGQLIGLDKESFGMSHLQAGYLTTAWFNASPVDVSDETVLFTLVLRSNTNGKTLSSLLRASSVITPIEAANENGDVMDIAFDFGHGTSLPVSFELFQNKPNPFNGQTVIGFNLPEDTFGKFSIYDVSGKLIYARKDNFSKGYNEIGIKRSDLHGSGVYYYELETNDMVARKKMVLTE